MPHRPIASEGGTDKGIQGEVVGQFADQEGQGEIKEGLALLYCWQGSHGPAPHYQTVGQRGPGGCGVPTVGNPEGGLSRVEVPSDMHGVVYVPLDGREAWKLTLAKELRKAGFEVDLNKL